MGFELARKRDNRLCSVEKANVMESGVLWREIVQALGGENSLPSMDSMSRRAPR